MLWGMMETTGWSAVTGDLDLSAFDGRDPPDEESPEIDVLDLSFITRNMVSSLIERSCSE